MLVFVGTPALDIRPERPHRAAHAKTEPVRLVSPTPAPTPAPPVDRAIHIFDSDISDRRKTSIRWGLGRDHTSCRLMDARMTRMLLLLMVTASAGLGTPKPVVAQDTTLELILEEEIAWSVPSGFAPTRIFLCPVNRILLYSPASAEFLLLDRSFDPVARASVPGTSVPIALIVTGNDELVTFDYNPPGLSRF